MADLSVDFCGIKSPNPFWLASAPPTNTGDQIMRAFDAGWGGAVWKTLGQPIVNVSSRYSSVDFAGRRMMGLNNIELITDRPLDVNLREISEVKKRYPKNALIVSLMVESKRETWHDIVRRAEDAGADGLELNFGCPHGMSERGMGSAVGQVPDYTCQIVEWVKEVAKTPVIVKLTPNITDVTFPARAAEKGGADAVSLINTINSVTGIDLETLTPRPSVHGASAHGGYCGPAVKPIALSMVASVAQTVKIPISGIGGISNWRDAAEFIALGASTGGPSAVVEILRHAPQVPVLLVIHIGKPFAVGLADWLSRVLPMPVSEAVDGLPLPLPGSARVIVAPPDRHLIVQSGRLRLTDAPERNSCRPAIDNLFESIAANLGPRAVGCLLTGMGRDGAEGLLLMRQRGAATIAQDQATSTVFGMPREAIRLGAAEHVLPLPEIGPALVRMTRAPAGSS